MTEHIKQILAQPNSIYKDSELSLEDLHTQWVHDMPQEISSIWNTINPQQKLYYIRLLRFYIDALPLLTMYSQH